MFFDSQFSSFSLAFARNCSRVAQKSSKYYEIPSWQSVRFQWGNRSYTLWPVVSGKNNHNKKQCPTFSIHCRWINICCMNSSIFQMQLPKITISTLSAKVAYFLSRKTSFPLRYFFSCQGFIKFCCDWSICILFRNHQRPSVQRKEGQQTTKGCTNCAC